MQGIARLYRSSAAIVLMLAVVGVVVMNVVGRIDGPDALDFIKWLVMAFFAKVAIEDGASKIALGKSIRTTVDHAANEAVLADEPRARMNTPSAAQTKKIKIEELLEKSRTSGPSPTEE
jgi:hypothetical protein